MNIRLFNPTDEEYTAIVAVQRAAWPDDPATVAEYKHFDDNLEEQHFFERYVVESDADIVADVLIGHTFWSFRPNKYFIRWNVLPEHEATLNRTILHTFEQKLLDQGATHLTVDCREDQPLRQLLLNNNYQQLLREPVSELIVADFDLTPYQSLDDHMRSLGITIVTRRELMAREPDTWAAKLEEAEWIMYLDVPASEPPTRDSLEVWLKSYESPQRSPDGHFIAVTEDGDYVGVTGLKSSAGKKLYTGMTAVKREWRRKGIATALKIASIRYAKTTEFTIIETDNEENNPMYVLNMQLGFKPQPAWLEMHKTIK